MVNDEKLSLSWLMGKIRDVPTQDTEERLGIICSAMEEVRVFLFEIYGEDEMIHLCGLGGYSEFASGFLFRDTSEYILEFLVFKFETVRPRFSTSRCRRFNDRERCIVQGLNRFNLLMKPLEDLPMMLGHLKYDGGVSEVIKYRLDRGI